MKMLYLHGLGSKFQSDHPKVCALEDLGEVVGITLDYCKGYTAVYETVIDFVNKNPVDLIVGTSLGGHMAACAGADLSIPFVALNPTISPSTTLQEWSGNFVDFDGQCHYLNPDVLGGYPDIAKTGRGLVIVETLDEVVKSRVTETELNTVFQVEVISGGSHRFEHIARAIPLIKTFYDHISMSNDTKIN